MNMTGDRLPLTVVIPTLNAGATLPATLQCVAGAAIVVSDGGSTDNTSDVALANNARVVTGPRGRGTQIAAGIEAAGEGWLLILHADTRLSGEWRQMARAHIAQGPSRAGYLRFALASADPRARRLERLVAWRCRWLGLPYGDQGLLIHSALLRAAGGMRSLPLMEDVDLVRRIGRSRLVPLCATATTSAAKWERDGWTGRSARNLCCLLLWFTGVPPRLIARLYA